MSDEQSTPVAPGPSLTGYLPVGKGGVSGSIRVTAVVDLTFEDGALTEVGFNAAQYTVFKAPDANKLSVASSFPKITL